MEKGTDMVKYNKYTSLKPKSKIVNTFTDPKSFSTTLKSNKIHCKQNNEKQFYNLSEWLIEVVTNLIEVSFVCSSSTNGNLSHNVVIFMDF